MQNNSSATKLLPELVRAILAYASETSESCAAQPVLLSCALVNRHWARVAVDLLWRDATSSRLRALPAARPAMYAAKIERLQFDDTLTYDENSGESRRYDDDDDDDDDDVDGGSSDNGCGSVGGVGAGGRGPYFDDPPQYFARLRRVVLTTARSNPDGSCVAPRLPRALRPGAGRSRVPRRVRGPRAGGGTGLSGARATLGKANSSRGRRCRSAA